MTRFASRTVGAMLALGMAAAWLYAEEPSDCPDTVIGTTTGMTYDLIGQSEVKVTISSGTKDFVEASYTYEETYNKGYYVGSDGRIIAVNCSTMKVV